LTGPSGIEQVATGRVLLLQADFHGGCGALVEAQERNAVHAQLVEHFLELAVRIVPEDDALVFGRRR